jgi:hypothetical protein
VLEVVRLLESDQEVVFFFSRDVRHDQDEARGSPWGWLMHHPACFKLQAQPAPPEEAWLWEQTGGEEQGVERSMDP